MSDSLSMRDEVRDGVVVMTLDGILDAVTSAEFRDRCLTLLATAPQGLVVDITGVPFVASSGLGTFLLISETGRNTGKPVWVAGATRTVREVLAMMNLTRFLDLQPDVEAALSAAAAPSA